MKHEDAMFSDSAATGLVTVSGRLEMPEERHVDPAPTGVPEPSTSLATDVALGCLLARIWEVQQSDTAQLSSLCDAAVALASSRTDDRGRLWAHLSRTLYTCADRPLAASQADLVIVQALRQRVGDPRAQHLADVCAAQVLQHGGRTAVAHERFMALPVGADARDEDADDFFVLHGRALTAARLGKVGPMFEALYANLVLAERTGPPVRYGIVAVALAEALVGIDHADEAMALLEHLFFTVGVPPACQRLWLAARHQLALCKSRCGRHAEALADLQQLADASAAFPYEPGAHAALVGLCNDQGRFDEAAAHLPLAYEAARAGGAAALGECHIGAARLARSRGDLHGAIALLERAIECFEHDIAAVVASPVRMSAGPLLAQCHADAGNFERAYGTHQRVAHLAQARADHLARGHVAAARAKQTLSQRIQLTERELKCLSWCAAGKTAWETGQILQISEWTVVYHLEKAKRKFGLTKKQQVVARAISLGLISAASATTNPVESPR